MSFRYCSFCRCFCLLLWGGLLTWLAGGCLPGLPVNDPTPVGIRSVATRLVPTRVLLILPTTTKTLTRTPVPSFTFTLISSPSPSPSITPTPEPNGCQEPPEDYTRLQVNGLVLNQRTYAMLQHAAELYEGELEITGHHITQGSYHDNGAASFGTHLGGGAVDLSVMRRGTYSVLWEDVEPLIYALRAAGFAAWLRSYGELFPDSPIHIHAIAIGDLELSPAAQEQLTGRFGYFRGYSGVLVFNGDPVPDRHGGPVLCQWMIDFGYTDMREP
jgi:hypothetical protein